MFFRAGETIPCAFGKLARDAAQERLLESEATALRKFDAADADFVPRLLHFGPIGNWAALVTEYRDWHSMAEKVIKGQYGSSPEHALARALETATQRLDSLHNRPEMTGMHGDFCFGNILEKEDAWMIIDWEMWDPERPRLWDKHLLCIDAAKLWNEVSHEGRYGAQEVIQAISQEWLANQCAMTYRAEDGDESARSLLDFLQYVTRREGALGADTQDALLWQGLRQATRENPALWAGMLGVEENLLIQACQEME